MARRELRILGAVVALALLLGGPRFLTEPVSAGEPAGGTEDFASALEKRVREHVLENGLHFLILERHEVPVVSFVTMANVGAVDEQVGITGIAHIFEHMAFKGSREIGTTDYAAEKKALAALDAKWAELMAERRKGDKADAERLVTLEEEFAALEAKADAYIVNNEYGRAVELNGGANLNASTGPDTTQYFISFPSNRLELWFHLESDRFREPVLRDFYKEKRVVQEERRTRTESNPIGKLLEEFTAAAFKAHPYGYPIVGHMSDLETLKRSEAEAFFRKYYVPNNMTIAIVGDVQTDRVIELAEKYFGSLPRGPDYEPVDTVEPPQEGERRVEVESQAQTIVGIGFHRPSVLHDDDAVYDVIADVLSSGRTSRLYERLVKKEQSALQAGAMAAYPGSKYPMLFVLYALPSVDHDADELEAALLEEAERLKTEPVAAEELARVKTRARARLIRGLNSNRGLGMQLAYAQAIAGDWREAFRSLARIEAVTADDVQRVARTTFLKKNRTVGKIVKPAEEVN